MAGPREFRNPQEAKAYYKRTVPAFQKRAELFRRDRVETGLIMPGGAGVRVSGEKIRAARAKIARKGGGGGEVQVRSYTRSRPGR